MAVTTRRPLSARVSAETRATHRAAQGSGFLDALAAGRLPIAAYADLAAQHWFVYQVLEDATRAMAGDPVAGPFAIPVLYRLPSLDADLDHLLGPEWRERIEARAATVAYRDRLLSVAFDSPTAFVAHHYTRYLGDLSGGQFLGPAIAGAYGLDGEGHRFFVFDNVDPPVFRSGYRRLLDAVPWSPAEQDEFLAEVIEAYRLNIAVLSELKQHWS